MSVLPGGGPDVRVASGLSMRLSSFSSALRIGLVALAASGGTFASVEKAEARNRRAAAQVYAPPYAAMVVDGKSGKILYAENPDALRHPASVTKVMTLYLLFEQIERGKMTLDTPLKVSAFAERQAPSKLALGAGDTIRVEDAIKALVTKSANDVAVVVAENIGGSEPAFAQLMTKKARALGMSRTVYKNASGLPDAGQVTTARDLITLGRAIQDRFPREYAYFSTRVFNYEGDAYANHNKLLGRVEGVDGIKTGFTRMSGFNLLTSVKHEGRQVVAVVLGGRSGPSRDRIMADLIEEHLPRATQGARTSPLVAENASEAPTTTAAVQAKAAPVRVAAATPATVAAVIEQGDVSGPATRVVSDAPASGAAVAAKVDAALKRAAVQETAAAKTEAVKPEPSAAMKWNKGAEATAASSAKAKPAPVKTASLAPVAMPSKPAGWYVQVGTADTQAKAKTLADAARAKAKAQLAKADLVTEKVALKRGSTFRARFTGLDERSAEAACKSLKKSGVECFAART